MKFEPGNVRLKRVSLHLHFFINLGLSGFQSDVVRAERRDHSWWGQQVF